VCEVAWGPVLSSGVINRGGHEASLLIHELLLGELLRLFTSSPGGGGSALMKTQSRIWGLREKKVRGRFRPGRSAVGRLPRSGAGKDKGVFSCDQGGVSPEREQLEEFSPG